MVRPAASALPSLRLAFPPPRFYLDKDTAHEAIAAGGMFNVVGPEEGDEVDFWLLTDEPFERSRSSRRRVEEVFGVRLVVSSPEDTLLAKLRWARLAGGSEKQVVDALRIYEVQAGALDEAYLADWAERLDGEALWERVRNEAEQL